MTAVAVQQGSSQRSQYNLRQSPHASTHTRDQSGQSFVGSSASNARAQGLHPNGSVSTASSSFPAPFVDTRRARGASGASTATMANGDFAGAGPTTNGDDAPVASHNGRNHSSSMLANRNGAREDPGPNGAARRPRSLLQRAKSDYGPRHGAEDSEDDDMQVWGARHGFEDHYASEEYVSQLANVSCCFFPSFVGSKPCIHCSLPRLPPYLHFFAFEYV